MLYQLSYRAIYLVDGTGIEPVAPCVSSKCSTAELTIHLVNKKPGKFSLSRVPSDIKSFVNFYPPTPSMNQSKATVRSAIRTAFWSLICLNCVNIGFIFSYKCFCLSSKLFIHYVFYLYISQLLF